MTDDRIEAAVSDYVKWLDGVLPDIVFPSRERALKDCQEALTEILRKHSGEPAAPIEIGLPNWAVYVLRSTIPHEPIALFRYADSAMEWAEKNYPGNCRVDKHIHEAIPAAALQAQCNALEADLADYKARFCEHHATPGAVPPGCPLCAHEALQAEVERLRAQLAGSTPISIESSLRPTLQSLVASASTDIGCKAGELQARLAGDVSAFVGRELLPREVLEAWSDLSLDAKAVAVLFATSLNDENEQKMDRRERW